MSSCVRAACPTTIFERSAHRLQKPLPRPFLPSPSSIMVLHKDGARQKPRQPAIAVQPKPHHLSHLRQSLTRISQPPHGISTVRQNKHLRCRYGCPRALRRTRQRNGQRTSLHIQIQLRGGTNIFLLPQRHHRGNSSTATRCCTRPIARQSTRPGIALRPEHR